MTTPSAAQTPPPATDGIWQQLLDLNRAMLTENSPTRRRAKLLQILAELTRHPAQLWLAGDGTSAFAHLPPVIEQAYTAQSPITDPDAPVFVAIPVVHPELARTVAVVYGAFKNLPPVVTDALLAQVQLTAKINSLDHRTGQLMTIAEVSRAIATELDVDKLLQRVADLLTERFDFQFVHIFVVHPERRWVELKAGRGVYVDYARHELSVSMDNKKGVIPWVARTGQSALINNVEEDTHFTPISLPGVEIRSELTVPLVFGGAVLGVFDIESERLNAFTPNDQWLLETLAANIAVALRNAMLYRSARWRGKAAESLRQIAKVVRARESLDNSLIAILEELAGILPLTFATIWQKTERGYRFKTGYRLPKDPPTGEMAHLWFDRVVAAQSSLVRQPTDPVPPLAEGFPPHHSAVSAVLAIDEKIYGVLVLVHRKPNRFGAEARRLTEIFASQAAFLIQTAQLLAVQQAEQQLRRELSLAREIQESFLPDDLPSVPGWEIADKWKMAKEVGGDFFDVFPLPDNRLLIIIADVADKGLPAALFMARTTSLVRATAVELHQPRDILARVNHLLAEKASQGMFVTAFCAVLDTATGEMTYASAGHNPPIVVRPDGQLDTLRTKGIVLGVMDPFHFEQKSTVLNPGDGVLFYTDGVTEAFNDAEEMFGEKRLRETVQRMRRRPAADVVQNIHDAVMSFAHPYPQSDDFTLLMIRRDAQSPPKRNTHD